MSLRWFMSGGGGVHGEAAPLRPARQPVCRPREHSVPAAQQGNCQTITVLIYEKSPSLGEDNKLHSRNPNSKTVLIFKKKKESKEKK